MVRRARRSALFPYTTLFRSPLSNATKSPAYCELASQPKRMLTGRGGLTAAVAVPPAGAEDDGPAAGPQAAAIPRSEEHTSELQSLTNLVCRLLLEKNNAPCG